jgi:hypothetical protein
LPRSPEHSASAVLRSTATCGAAGTSLPPT